ncbi:MAG: hypothetical protein BWY99_02253 [Synergistetes bacterium ADurb.BinA166]|nr:MAG: hypothetical protein BWY99_02253 [Synergistetes bacterium ADurb.BinA166]
MTTSFPAMLSTWELSPPSSERIAWARRLTASAIARAWRPPNSASANASPITITAVASFEDVPVSDRASLVSLVVVSIRRTSRVALASCPPPPTATGTKNRGTAPPDTLSLSSVTEPISMYWTPAILPTSTAVFMSTRPDMLSLISSPTFARRSRS